MFWQLSTWANNTPFSPPALTHWTEWNIEEKGRKKKIKGKTETVKPLDKMRRKEILFKSSLVIAELARVRVRIMLSCRMCSCSLCQYIQSHHINFPDREAKSYLFKKRRRLSAVLFYVEPFSKLHLYKTLCQHVLHSIWVLCSCWVCRPSNYTLCPSYTSTVLW